MFVQSRDIFGAVLEVWLELRKEINFSEDPPNTGPKKEALFDHQNLQPNNGKNEHPSDIDGKEGQKNNVQKIEPEEEDKDSQDMVSENLEKDPSETNHEVYIEVKMN